MPSASHVRVCQVIKQPDEQFEFNLKEDEARKCQVISAVTPQGPADRGGLKNGDRIISVNDVNVENKSHAEVVGLIRESMPTHEIKFEVVDEEHVSDISASAPKSTANNVEDLRPRICKIVKKRGTLGFHLEAQGQEGKTGHFIKEVADGGPAAESGLRKGDRIIEVGGTNIEKMNHARVVSHIKKSGNKVTLLVVDEATYKHYTARKMKIKAKRAYSSSDVVSNRSTSSISGSVTSDQGPKFAVKSTSSAPTLQTSSDDVKLRLIHVIKETGRGYGFFLRVRKGEKGDYIGELETGKPGERCGLMDDDRVVAINGHLTLTTSHEENVQLIKSIPNHVIFLVAGPKAIAHAKNNGLIESLSGATKHLLEKPKRVKLHKGADGYGFFLKMDPGSPQHIVSDIEDGSVAEKAGLRNGDVVSCVGDVNVMHLKHNECVQKIKEAGNAVELTTGEAKTMSILYDLGVKVTPEFVASWPAESNFLLPDVTEHDNYFKDALIAAVVNEAKSPSENKRICKLKKIDGGFGFFLRDDSAHYLMNVEDGGAAHVAGVQEDDEIIEINGLNVQKKDHDQVVAMIRRSGDEVTFLVRHSKAASTSKTEPESQAAADEKPPHPRFCELSKEKNTFGFHLNVEDGDRPGQYIRNLAEGGAGVKAGLLEGDRLIEVNGESISNKSHDDVVEIIKASGDQVNFLVVDREADIYYSKKGIKITKTLIASSVVTAVQENADTDLHSSASSVIEAEATVHVSSEEQTMNEPDLSFPPPPPSPPQEEQVEDAVEENNEVHEDDVKRDLEIELDTITERIREQAEEEMKTDELREEVKEDIKDATVAVVATAIVEEVKDEFQEEKQEKPIEAVTEDLKEEVIEEIAENIVEEAKEDAEERLKEEVRQKIEREIQDEIKRKVEEELKQKEEEERRQKVEEEMRRKLEEELKQKAEEEIKRKLEEEMKQKAEEEMRRKLEEELKQKAEEEMRRKLEEELKQKAEEEMRERKAEELRQKEAKQLAELAVVENKSAESLNKPNGIDEAPKQESVTSAARKASDMNSFVNKEEKKQEKPFKPTFISARAMFESGSNQQKALKKPNWQRSAGTSAKQTTTSNGNVKPTRLSSSSGKPLPFKIIETSAVFTN